MMWEKSRGGFVNIAMVLFGRREKAQMTRSIRMQSFEIAGGDDHVPAKREVEGRGEANELPNPIKSLRRDENRGINIYR